MRPFRGNLAGGFKVVIEFSLAEPLAGNHGRGTRLPRPRQHRLFIIDDQLGLHAAEAHASGWQVDALPPSLELGDLAPAPRRELRAVAAHEELLLAQRPALLPLRPGANLGGI